MAGTTEQQAGDTVRSLVSREHHPHDTTVSVGRTTVGGGHVAWFLMTEEAHVAAPLRVLTSLDQLIAGPQPEAWWVSTDVMRAPEARSALVQSPVPVFLSRTATDSVQDWLTLAESLCESDLGSLILAESAIHQPHAPVPCSLDVAVVAWLREHTHLPIAVRPTVQGAQGSLVLPMAQAAIAAGADAVVIDGHQPAGLTSATAHSGGGLSPHEFATLQARCVELCRSLGRR